MIIQKQKPIYVAHCDVCGAEDPIAIEEFSAMSEAQQTNEQADKLGYSLVGIHVTSASRCERGQTSMLVCPLCLRAIISTIAINSNHEDQLWNEVSRFMPDEIKARIDAPIGKIKQLARHENKLNNLFDQIEKPVEPVMIQVNDAVMTVVKGTYGLPMSTATILQHVACDQGSYGPEEQAALQRLVGQEGTAEDINLFRALAKLANVNLPLTSQAVENQLRTIESVHEELRKNA
jgi:hypothetical protein